MIKLVLPASTLSLLDQVWVGLQKVNPLNPRILGLLAFLLFLTDIGYEGQRFPEKILPLTLFSVLSILVFFLVYFASLPLSSKIQNDIGRGIARFFFVIVAEVTKSAVLIFLLHRDAFLLHYFERLPGDISLAALYWMIAGVISTAFDSHKLAILELNRASERLEEQRNLRLETATSTELELKEKANTALLGELDRLSELSQSVLDSAESSHLKLQIQSLIRNQVRPLSRELRSRVEILQSRVPKPAKTTRFTEIYRLKLIPLLDTSLVASYFVAIPNIFFTVLSKTAIYNSSLILLVSFSYPVIGRLLQFLLPKEKGSIPKGLFLAGMVSAVAYLPTGFTIAFFASNYPLLEVTAVTAGAVFLLTTLLGTTWFLLERERDEKVQALMKVNAQTKHELDLLDQAIWVAQRKWSYLIHGTVQAALTVAASRLEMANRTDDRLKTAVRSDIERAKSTLTSPPELSAEIGPLLVEIAQTWQGVCEFDYQVSPSVMDVLSKSPTSATCFVEIVKELVSNASRHGGATKFWLNAYLNKDGDLEMVAGNNGKPLGNEAAAGFGFQMISALTKNWRFEREKATGFSATLPLPRSL